jgi:flagellar protein FlgJ
MQLDMAQVYTDFSGLAALKSHARKDQHAALDQVARQFESLFVQMMLKSMRDASFGGGLLDSQQSQFYRDMYDEQIALHLSQDKGIGLAAEIKRQLGGAIAPQYEGMTPREYLGTPVLAQPASAGDAVQDPDAVAARPGAGQPVLLDGSPDTFLASLWPLAEEAAARLQLAPEAMLAQAALETGWGKHVMRRGDGSSSHNLFGIKADARWQGESVRVDTLEYQDGVAVKQRARFRAYPSYRESFHDYVDFLQRNPRYQDALRNTGDARAYFDALQDAGYATDPAYARKIGRILDGESMQRALGSQQGDASAI